MLHLVWGKCNLLNDSVDQNIIWNDNWDSLECNGRITGIIEICHNQHLRVNKCSHIWKALFHPGKQWRVIQSPLRNVADIPLVQWQAVHNSHPVSVDLKVSWTAEIKLQISRIHTVFGKYLNGIISCYEFRSAVRMTVKQRLWCSKQSWAIHFKVKPEWLCICEMALLNTLCWSTGKFRMLELCGFLARSTRIPEIRFPESYKNQNWPNPQTTY